MYLLIYRKGSHLFSFYINSAKKKIKIGGDDGDILFPPEMKGYEIVLRKEFDFKEKKYQWTLYPSTAGFSCNGENVSDGAVFSGNCVLSVQDFSFSLSYNSNIDYKGVIQYEKKEGGTLLIDGDGEQFKSVLFEFNGKEQRFAFKEGKELSVGRKKADIILPFAEVSQEHLLLVMKNDGVIVWNKGKNGTYSNGAKIENCVLHEGKYQFLLAGRHEVYVTVEKEGSAESFYKGRLSPLFERIEQWINQKGIFNSHPIIYIYGESGTGKEIFAEFAHTISNRKGEFVTFNAAAIPGELAESELFGTCKGGFTGAEERDGAFLLADKGTLFLDEIGDMSLALQSKLLRVLEDWQIRKVGEKGSGRKVDVMVIVATNKNLAQEVENGNFRKDLYYRLSTLNVNIPPLRERKEDIIPLARHLIFSLAGQRIEFSDDAVIKLSDYSWPGNVRELKSVMTKFAYRNKLLFESEDFESL